MLKFIKKILYFLPFALAATLFFVAGNNSNLDFSIAQAASGDNGEWYDSNMYYHTDNWNNAPASNNWIIVTDYSLNGGNMVFHNTQTADNGGAAGVSVIKPTLVKSNSGKYDSTVIYLNLGLQSGKTKDYNANVALGFFFTQQANTNPNVVPYNDNQVAGDSNKVFGIIYKKDGTVLWNTGGFHNQTDITGSTTGGGTLTTIADANKNPMYNGVNNVHMLVEIKSDGSSQNVMKIWGRNSVANLVTAYNSGSGTADATLGLSHGNMEDLQNTPYYFNLYTNKKAAAGSAYPYIQLKEMAIGYNLYKPQGLSATSTSITYTGSTITPAYSFKNSAGTTLTKDTYWSHASGGTASATNVGNYTAKVDTLRQYFIWSKMYNYSLAWSITKANSPITFSNQSKTMTYDITAQSVSLTAASNGKGTVTYTKRSEVNGSSTATTYFSVADSSSPNLTMNKNTPAGTYTVVLRASDAGTSNYNSKTVDATMTITVNKKSFTKPTKTSATYTFNGSSQTLAMNNYDSKYMTAAYHIQTDAGNYTAQISLNDTTNTQWSDGTTSRVDIAWSIAPKTSGDVYPTINGTKTTSVSVTYDGTSKEPTIGVYDNERKTALVGEEEWSYTAKRGSSTTTDWTNAGTITLTFSGVGNYAGISLSTVTYTINKANISPSVSMSGWTYGASASNPSVSGNTGSGAVTYEYKVSTAADSTYTTTKPSNAGTYTVRATIAATTNYNGATAITNFTIAKAASSVTAAPTANDLTYTGSAQALVNAGTASGGTLQYSLTSGSGYSTTIPTGTNAGNYTVYYKVVGDSNHNDTAESSVVVTIAKADPTYTAPVANDLTYNREAQTLITTGSTSHGTIQYSSNGTSWSGTIPTGTNAGDYTVYWKLTGDSNHNDVASTFIAVTISPKSVTPRITLDSSKYIYDANSHTPVSTIKDSSYTLSAGTDYTLSYSNSSTSSDDRTSVGTITITATLKGNYSGSNTATYIIDGSLLEFIDEYMHMDDIYDRGYCKDAEHHWYTSAKEGLLDLDENFTNEEYIEAFTNNACYNDAYVRYIAWSHFNNDDEPFSDGRDLSLFIKDYYNYPKEVNDTSSNKIIIMVVACSTLLLSVMCLNLLIIRKKKHINK